MRDRLQPLCILLLTLSLQVYAEENIEPALLPGEATVPDALSQNGLEGESIDIRTGKFELRNTDLSIPGNGGLDIVISRAYQKNLLPNYGVPHSIGSWELELPRITGNVGQTNYCQDPRPSWVQAQYEPLDLFVRYVSVLDTVWSNAGRNAEVYAYDKRYGYPSIYFSESINRSDVSRWGQRTISIERPGFQLRPELIERQFLGLQLSIPGQASKDLLSPASGSVGAGFAYITTDYWKSICIAKDGVGGAGFLVTSPEGVKYTFDKSYIVETNYEEAWRWNPRLPVRQAENLRRLRHYYPSKIEDRYGNTLTFGYIGDTSGALHVSKITASDGRIVDFRYNAQKNVGRSKQSVSLLKEIESNGQVWRYVYNAQSQLQKVVQPDGGTWEYTYQGAPYVERFGKSAIFSPAILKTVKYPTGGLATYTYQTKLTDYFGGTTKNREGMYVVRTRDTSGPNIVAGKTVYQFDINTAGQNRTRIATSAGLEEFVFHRANDWKLGSLLVQRTFDSSPQDLSKVSDLATIDTNSLQLLQETSYAWKNLPQIGDTAVRDRPVAKIIPRVLSQKTVTRDGTQYVTSYANHDAYGNPLAITEAAGTDTKSTTYTYFTDPGRWILHQVANQTIQGVGLIERKYFPDGTLDYLDSFGVRQAFTYYPDGEVQTATNPNGVITRYSQYVRGTPEVEVRAENSPEAVSIGRIVNGSGTVRSETIDEKTTTYSYDGMNRIKTITKPDASSNTTTIDYIYSAAGLTRSLTRGSFQENRSFDGFGRLKDISAEGITRSSTYDAVGRLVFQAQPNSTDGDQLAYDSLNRIKKLTHSGDNTAVNYSYLPGNKIQIVNERGHTSTYTYRSYGDPDSKTLIAIDAPEAISTVFERDLLGNIKKVTQGSSVRDYVYDSRYYLDYMINPETGKTDVSYDNAGNLITRQTGASGITTYTYDNLNRLDYIAYPAGTPDVDYEYYPNGELKNVQKGDSLWSYQYDANDNLIQELFAAGINSYAIDYSYNGNDALESITYPSGFLLTYNPDDLGRPTQVGHYVPSIQYHPNGQPDTLSYSNGVKTTLTQDRRERPQDYDVASAYGSILDMRYGYDGVGNIETIDDNILSLRGLSLGYDGVDRLTTVGGAPVISYDTVGNIQSKKLGANDLAFAYDGTTNLLTSVTNAGSPWFSLQYDLYGNVTSNGFDTFTYDDASQLVSVTSQNIQYQYDGNGRRFLEKDGVNAKYTLYSKSGVLLFEDNQATGNAREYMYLGNQLIARRDQCPDIDDDGDGIPSCVEVRAGLDPNDSSDGLLDADSDGLNNAREYQLGTNAFVADTDSDGIDDGYEVRYSLNPLANDAQADKDLDGLTNLAEFKLGTNPARSDTDGDGVSDSDEIAAGTDPNFNLAAMIPIWNLLLQ